VVEMGDVEGWFEGVDKHALFGGRGGAGRNKFFHVHLTLFLTWNCAHCGDIVKFVLRFVSLVVEVCEVLLQGNKDSRHGDR
jgi:hypothetical protein